jgi:hypothetical protein
MTQEVKDFNSGVLSNGGSIQRVQNREAKREEERLRKEAEEKNAAESVARRQKAKEERAIELAEQSKARQLAEEEKRRKADEKAAQDEVARLKAVADKEAARLERQQDLERRNAERATAQRQEEARRKSQSAALLDDLGKDVISEEVDSSEESEEVQEPIFAPVKGEVQIPAEVSSFDAKQESEPLIAHDISELLPPPAVLTVESEPQTPIQVESGKELIERVLHSTEQASENQPQEVAQTKRSENRYQKIINTNRELAKENDSLKSRVEDLLDKLHGYEIEGELVGSIMTSVDRNKREKWREKSEANYLKNDRWSVIDEAKKEILNYLSTRHGEVDYLDKSQLFLKYMQDPFYMNVFVQNHQVSQWWPTIDAIYNSIDLQPKDWSKVKPISYKPQPIRARTATLGAPVASSEEPMDRIAQHLGNMGI